MLDSTSDLPNPPTLFDFDPSAIDRIIHTAEARATMSLSPAILLLAYLDWAIHLANAPGKRSWLAKEALAQGLALLESYGSSVAGSSQRAFVPSAKDHRFRDPSWQKLPFNVFQQAFLAVEHWWEQATVGICGVSRANERIVNFVTRQFLDAWAPSNFVATNPEVLRRTAACGGRNFIDGAANFAEDWRRGVHGDKPVGAESFPVGERVAVTPGVVILRNDLIELIQYSPATPRVYAEPVLIVPAWIMKYYILDLSPENSLIRYLVAAGHTVFVISWRNPGTKQRYLGMHDYRLMGPMAALEAIAAVCPEQKVHVCGYCLGGTLMAITAAAMTRDGIDSLASLTLLAAEVDFTEAGELLLFITESQIAYLEDAMETRGYLDSRQMAGAFQMLRSNDLVWSRSVKEYLMGERPPMIDLMAWNADATRLPARMHSEYLRHMFLNNDLAEGRYVVDGRPVALSDIRVPLFAVSTEADHVSPWRSVYKIHLLTRADVTFVLASGGHNAGIISEPGHHGHSFRMAARRGNERYLDPEEWALLTPTRHGSWWPAWERWLAVSSGPQVAPPSLGAKNYVPLADAPGSYVHEA